jgi:hypothetical protein
VDAPAKKAPDHTAIHGSESIVADNDDRAYYLWSGGRRYVHVGEYNGKWVYRPD